MKFNPDIHHRRSNRLEGYDYSREGAYFITICTQNRDCVFGEIRKGNMILSGIGRIVHREWMRSFSMRDEIEMDEWVVMPNHMHAIVMLSPSGENRESGRGDRPVALTEMPRGLRPRSLGSFIAGFKSAATRRINKMQDTPGTPVWQRNYYDHIIRSEEDLNAIRIYIAENPSKWAEDENHPDHIQEK